MHTEKVRESGVDEEWREGGGVRTGKASGTPSSDPEFVDSIFTYDLAGNRTSVEKDTNGDGVIVDKITKSTFDANDRLLKEEVDNDGDGVFDDKVTTYSYGPDANGDGADDWTVQTGKEVTENGTRTTTTNTYNLQGRLASVTVESFDGHEARDDDTRL